MDETARNVPKQYEDLVRVIGLDATVRLCSEYGGGPMYVPKVDGLVGYKRTDAIRREYNGQNVRRLAIKYKLSVRAVQLMVQGRRPPEIDGQVTLQDIMQPRKK
jgi:Mor family transcriptional regulator